MVVRDSEYYLSRIDKKLNVLLNMIDSYMIAKYKLTFDIDKGEFVEVKKK